MTVADPPDLDRTAAVAEEPPAPDGDAPERLAVPVPVWLEIGLLFGALVAVCCGGFGLALAVVDRYSFGLSVGVGAPAAVVLTALGAIALVGRHDRRPDRRGGQLPAVVAVLGAAVYTAWNVLRSGEWMLIDRDAGVYAVTAKWLTQHSGLVVPFQADWAGTGLPLQGSTGGIYESGGTLEMQFNHLLPVLLAQASHVVGDRGQLSGNSLILTFGLLAVYVTGVRLVGRPWIVLAAVAGLAVSLPVLYVGRASWSEAVTMLLLWCGTWLIVTSWDRRSIVLAVLAGLVLGGSVMGRVDALVYLAPVPIVAAVVVLLLGVDDRWRRFALLVVGLVVGAAAPVAVGTFDVVERAGFYYRDLVAQVGLLQKASLAALVVGLVAVVLARPLRPVVRAVQTRLSPRWPTVAAVLGALTFLLVVYAWALRPVLDHPMGSGIPLIGGLQAREGLPSEPARLYSEQGVVWLSWYLGVPAVALAAAGLGIMVRRMVSGGAAAVAVLTTTGAGTLLYVYRLSNTPDQLFGVRRYVPAVLPLCALGAAVAIGALATALPALLGPAAKRWWRVVVAVPALALVVFPLGTTGPLRSLSMHRGSLAAVDAVCAAVGPDAALVFPAPDYGQIVAPQTFRSWCDVPVAGVTRDATPTELKSAATAWAARGRTLWAVDVDPAKLTALYGAAAVKVFGSVNGAFDPVLTLSRPPDSYTAYAITFYGAVVPR